MVKQFSLSPTFYCFLILLKATHTERCFTSEELNSLDFEDIFPTYVSSRYPSHRNGSRYVVDITLLIRFISVNNMNFENKVVDVEMYVQQSWLDVRLQYCSSTPMQFDYLEGIKSSKVWLPDTFIANEKTGFGLTQTDQNTRLKIKPSGKIYYTQKRRVLFSCDLQLTWFPMDTQLCEIRFESYEHSANHITYRWRPNSHDHPFEEDTEISPKYNFVRFDTKKIVRAEGNITSPKVRNYDHLILVMVIARRIGYYVVSVYLPLISVVMTSWASFWLPITSVPARASIGSVTVLSLVVQASEIQRRMPHVSYMKAVDLYILICLIFVMASLAEFCAASYFNTYFEDSTEKKSKNGKCNNNENNEKTEYARINSPETRSKTKKLSRIDFYSAIFFPVSFILFNIVFWMGLYLRAGKTT